MSIRLNFKIKEIKTTGHLIIKMLYIKFAIFFFLITTKI